MTAIEPEMVRIPAGVLAIGVPAFQGEFFEDLRPWHTGKTVEMAAFSISKYAITNREYRDYVAKAGAGVPMRFDDPAFNADNQPVVGISWLDGAAYCEWLQAETGKPYHMPTDAQYEYTARGGNEGAKYPWGDDLDPSRASYGGHPGAGARRQVPAERLRGPRHGRRRLGVVRGPVPRRERGGAAHQRAQPDRQPGAARQLLRQQ